MMDGQLLPPMVLCVLWIQFGDIGKVEDFVVRFNRVGPEEAVGPFMIWFMEVLMSRLY